MYEYGEDEERSPLEKLLENTTLNFIEDTDSLRIFGEKEEEAKKLDIREVKLANLTPAQEAQVSSLYSFLLQIEALEKKYHERGVPLDLRTVKRAILADIKAIAATSRGRRGFERKLWVTNISREEYAGGEGKKKKILGGVWGREDE